MAAFVEGLLPFQRDPRCCETLARLGVGCRQWLFPYQVLQHRMARFFAQPEGPGLF